MSDIVERLRTGSYSLPSEGEWIERNGDTIPNNVCSQAADEIEVLRQRVKELEMREQDLSNALDIEAQEYRRLESKLAALKQSQGEPVAIVSVDAYGVNNRFWDGKSTKEWDTPAGVPSVFWFKSIPEVGTKLYTSAPTIPEGWQLVTTERMKELEEYEFMYKSVSK